MDPIHNNVYVPVRQWPLDASSPDTGDPGILVFNDPAPIQATPSRSQAQLGSNGTVNFTLRGRTMIVESLLQGVDAAATELVITTTVGNEVVNCGVLGGQANCFGALIGDPLIGGMALLGNGGKILSKGRIALAQ